MFLPAAVTVDYKPPRRGMLYTAAAAVLVSADIRHGRYYL